MMLRWLGILVAAVACAGAAQAQTIYKCTDGKGGTAFQQSPCERSAKTESVRSYQRQPDAPHDYGQYEQPESFQFQGEPARSDARRTQSQHQVSRQPDINPMSADAEMMRRRANMAGSREGRAILRQMSGQQLPRAAVATPDPDQSIGLPTRVIDSRTGMPIEGAIKVAPNRVWDPKTGEYYWTTP